MREQVGYKGYANGFEGLLGFINGLVSTNEVIGQALRRTVPMFPKNRAMASRLIRDAVSAGVIVAHDPDTAPKLMKYIPWWARQTA